MKLTSEERSLMAKTIVAIDPKIYVKPFHGKYKKCFCTMCQKTFKITDDQLKEIRNSHMCPICWRSIDKICDHDYKYLDYIKLDDHEYSNVENGFQISFDWNFDHPKNLRIKWVAKWVWGKPKETKYGTEYNATTYVRDIVLGMYAHNIYPAWDPTGKWRISKSSNYYYNMHNVVKFDQDHSLKTRDYTVFDNPKKTYLEDTLGGLNIKSSQLEIARKHILNPLQLRRMLMFDLNDYKDVKKSNYKYDSYWWQRYGEDSGIGEVKECMDFHLNKYDQQYLLKNGLSLSDFLDYLKQCKKLGIKNKHPKCFTEEHAKLSEKCREIEVMEHKEMMKNCKKIINSIVKELPEYKNGDMTIRPVKSADELKKNAKYMHNCIYGYLDEYLERKCILYIVRKKRKIVANVELHGSNIIQIRARFNEDPSKDISKAVEEMVVNNRRVLNEAALNREA
jgi:hypothetical protein